MAQEIWTLERHGVVFEDLVAGRRPCKTAVQKRFVEVAKGQRDPETYDERLWRKYLACCELELQQRPRSTAVDPAPGPPAPSRAARYRTVAHPSPTFETLRHVVDEREGFKRGLKTR